MRIFTYTYMHSNIFIYVNHIRNTDIQVHSVHADKTDSRNSGMKI